MTGFDEYGVDLSGGLEDVPVLCRGPTFPKFKVKKKSISVSAA